MLVGFGVGPGLIAHHALFQTEASEEERRPCALQPGSGCVIDRLRKQNRPLRLQMGFRAKMWGAWVDMVRSVRPGGHAGIGGKSESSSTTSPAQEKRSP